MPFMVAALFVGCSSEEEALAPEAVETQTEAAKLVVTESGVVDIPLVATRGTSKVTVQYTSAGTSVRMDVPFTQVSQQTNGAMVSGYARVYSATPTCVNVYDGDALVGENILLPGMVTTATATTRAASPEVGDMDAMYVVRFDGDQPIGDDGDSETPGYLFHPYHDMTGHITANTATMGRIYTEGMEWNYDGTVPYIYSSDGSAVAPYLATVPDVLANPYWFDATGYSKDDYKVIWYKVKKYDRESYVVYGLVTKKDAKEVTPLPYDEKLTDTVLPAPVDPDQPTDDQVKQDGIYHNNGVVMYDRDGDKDYNDLVVDYDVEARFPKADGQFPYVKLTMHLRAMGSEANLDNVSMAFKGLNDYVCEQDDFNITFHGISSDKLGHDVPEAVRHNTLVPSVEAGTDNLRATIGGLGWVLSNKTPGWYDLDEHGCYNLTQQTFNGKPFATLSVMLYPKSDATEADVEAEIASILDVAKQGFLFNGGTGDYIVAPVGTPHVAEPYSFGEAFPMYPEAGWWTYDGDQHNYDAAKVVNINK